MSNDKFRFFVMHQAFVDLGYPVYLLIGSPVEESMGIFKMYKVGKCMDFFDELNCRLSTRCFFGSMELREAI